jgi:hypothetical protein
LVALPLFLLGVWGIIFHAPFLAVVALLGTVVVLPVLEKIRFVPWAKLGLAFLILISLAVSRVEPIREVNSRIALLGRKSPSEYSNQDKLGVWGLNLVMAGCGFVLFPEVAWETLQLVFPANRGDTLVFKSDFALGSRRIRSVLSNFRRTLPEGRGPAARRLEPVTMSWSPDDFVLSFQGYREARCALALNPVTVSATATRKDGDWRMDVICSVAVSYAREGAYVTFIPRTAFTPELTVDERVFWVLQESHWLHPYTAHWRCTVSGHDRRLGD